MSILFKEQIKFLNMYYRNKRKKANNQLKFIHLLINKRVQVNQIKNYIFNLAAIINH